jgi:hypothetical protein
MKPGSNSVEDRPQLRDPVDGALVSAGSMWREKTAPVPWVSS